MKSKKNPHSWLIQKYWLSCSLLSIAFSPVILNSPHLQICFPPELGRFLFSMASGNLQSKPMQQLGENLGELYRQTTPMTNFPERRAKAAQD